MLIREFAYLRACLSESMLIRAHAHQRACSSESMLSREHVHQRACTSENPLLPVHREAAMHALMSDGKHTTNTTTILLDIAHASEVETEIWRKILSAKENNLVNSSPRRIHQIILWGWKNFSEGWGFYWGGIGNIFYTTRIRAFKIVLHIIVFNSFHFLMASLTENYHCNVSFQFCKNM